MRTTSSTVVRVSRRRPRSSALSSARYTPTCGGASRATPATTASRRLGSIESLKPRECTLARMSLLQQNAKLLAVSRPVTFAAGERLVRQGEATRGAFIIEAGFVEAQVAMPGSGMLTVAELHDGHIFGEIALIERSACSV